MNKKTIFQYGLFAVLFLVLTFTGLGKEVAGLLQRGVLATGIMQPKVPEPAEASGLPAADFSLQLVDEQGNQVDMAAFKGKVIFLNLWASWCPPCLAEMPAINELYAEMEGEVAFIMLSVDEDFEKARRLKAKKGYNFPIYRPLNGLPRMYYSQSIPTTYVINANGELALTQTGMADYHTEEFKEFLRSLK